MSTQQILGVVGGVVGAFFGYPQLGFVVGSLVGGLLTPGEKTEGPRVDDLKVQVSTYGAGIPILYGTERVGGNVVWSTDKIETSETQGGKGGEPEHTSYRYFVHMGIVLCETPLDGSIVSIVQIFQDGKLIYDARSGMPVGSALASAENPHAFFVLYQGHADQLPDPIEELYEDGPGSVPAYRGVVRIRMNAIECPGGRVPQYSFVLSNNASKQPEVLDFNSMPNSPVSYTGIVGPNSTAHVALTRQGGDNYAPAYEIGTDYVTQTSRTRTVFASDLNFQPLTPANGSFDDPISVCSRYDGDNIVYEAVYHKTGQTGEIYSGNDDDGRAHITLGLYDSFTNRFALSVTNDARMLVFPDETYSPDFTGTLFGRSFYDGVLSTVYYTSPSQMRLIQHQIDADGSWTTVRDIAIGTFVPGWSCLLLHTSNGLFARVVEGGDLHFFEITTSAVLLSTTVLGVWPANLERTFFCNREIAVVGPFYTGTVADYKVIRHSVTIIGSVKVSDIVAEQCERGGESRYDVTGIPDADTLHGFKLQNPASARSNVGPLLTAFAIYIVDEDGAIKFKKYEDIESEATIAYDELGQAEDGSEPADAMPLNRAQEVDMPRSVTASYVEPAFDYQTASEKEVRQMTEATEDLIVELPMATNSSHAKQVASMILFAKWRAQNTRSFKTSRKYAFLSPGDGVTVEYPRGTSRLWRITSMTDTGVLCEFNVEPGDAELYTQTAIGATGYVQQEVAPLPPPTRMVIGDWAMLRDADNNAGPYIAMEGYGSIGWGGAELFIGDDDSNLESRGTVSSPAIIGIAESVLGAWDLGIVDETNLVTIDIGDDALSSITREVLLAGATNVFALGAAGRWEIAQFQRADALGGGRYILSGLRRGLKGTEYAAAAHENGDTFVLLTVAGMLKPGMESGAIGQTRSYRAITKGRSFSSASSQTYAATGEPLRPLGPVDLRKSISGNDIVITWHRRTRMSENVLAGIFPLGEASERYVLELCTDSTFAAVIRTFAITSETATYTEAMQDFDGYVSGPLYARVSQVSDSVGLGHSLEAII